VFTAGIRLRDAERVRIMCGEDQQQHEPVQIFTGFYDHWQKKDPVYLKALEMVYFSIVN
jgi:hypothetical protein